VLRSCPSGLELTSPWGSGQLGQGQEEAGKQIPFFRRVADRKAIIKKTPISSGRSFGGARRGTAASYVRCTCPEVSFSLQKGCESQSQQSTS